MSEWDGYPDNPERSGWHWLARMEYDLTLPKRWNAEVSFWEDGIMLSPKTVLEHGVRYIGPCLTPSEVAAREQAARRGAMEETARICELERPSDPTSPMAPRCREGN